MRLTTRIGAGAGAAGMARAPAAAQELWPGATYDPAIPTIKSVLGHDVGEEISTPEEIAIYLRALAAAAPGPHAPGRVRAHLGRPAAARAGHRLAGAHRAVSTRIKADLKRLADPRTICRRRQPIVSSRELPVVVWLMHAVHGNEISSSDAALAEAYHLLAARRRSGGRRDPAQTRSC